MVNLENDIDRFIIAQDRKFDNSYSFALKEIIFHKISHIAFKYFHKRIDWKLYRNTYYFQALKEIRNGRKVNHWIWFIFPQLRGLGHSRNSNYYGICDKEEAHRYITNPMLRDRMFEITNALLEHNDKTAHEIFGRIDAVKVQSCMTLFDCIEPNGIFEKVLDLFYDGERDPKSIV